MQAIQVGPLILFCFLSKQLALLGPGLADTECCLFLLPLLGGCGILKFPGLITRQQFGLKILVARSHPASVPKLKSCTKKGESLSNLRLVKFRCHSCVTAGVCARS